jgi:GNAT superfamily N-acetyltransferase
VSHAVAPLDPARPGVAEALTALQRESYAVEATLLGVPALPPMDEAPSALRAAGLTWLGARDAGGLCGALAYLREGELVDVHRLAVHPRAFRRGVATALLDAVEAREADARRWTVGTGERNAPALALYARRGFRAAEVREPVPGLRWVRLDRG